MPGTTPGNRWTPASTALPTASRSWTSPRSKESAPAPAARKRSSGARGAQQCSTTGPGRRRDHGGELLLDDVRLHGRQLAEAADGGQAALQHGRHRRLVQLDDDAGARHPCGDVGDVGGQPLGEGLGEVAAAHRVDDRPVAAAALQAGRQRPRAGRPAP